MDAITQLWNTLFFQPMLNGLIVLYSLLFHNFGLTIFVFTVIIRTIMYPLTMKQLQASKAMSMLQPRIQEIQKKYGKDRERLSKETMALYKEHGVNPLGCAVPTILQFPIWIGLYQSITFALGDKPESMLNLAQHLYSGLELATRAIPLNNHFLWLDLAAPDQTYILPILVGASMWLQQKMMAMPMADPQQAQMNKMMQTMMPLMFAFFTVSFASGLAIYWVTSNVISIVLQYRVTGWGSLRKIPQFEWVRDRLLGNAAPAPTPIPAPTPKTPAKGRKRT
ncbi:MAG: YidC/Oxa1 family membrane protein insertase [Dehalococcoidia bacterium]|nr:YidC/Oxa1 family membrane protein insertase [Dehalococcoidia bacterium]